MCGIYSKHDFGQKESKRSLKWLEMQNGGANKNKDLHNWIVAYFGWSSKQPGHPRTPSTSTNGPIFAQGFAFDISYCKNLPYLTQFMSFQIKHSGRQLVCKNCCHPLAGIYTNPQSNWHGHLAECRHCYSIPWLSTGHSFSIVTCILAFHS